MLRRLMTDHPDAQPWRVAAVDGILCTLYGVDAEGEHLSLRARPPGEPVAVGDWGVIAEGDEDPPRMTAVLERSTWLRRDSVHRQGQPQWIAANLDTVFIVSAFAHTDKLEGRALNARRLDRFIAAVEEGGAIPVVIVNKVDIAERSEDELQTLRNELSTRLGGITVLTVSADEGLGLEALQAWLSPGETVAFVGPSGVGKSSLINALLGDAKLEVGKEREVDAKGRHTTTRRQLLSLPTGALVIDTPGVREIAAVGEEHVRGFDDVREVALQCRFADCGHDSEPGCAVQAAVAAGELLAERVESYQNLEAQGRHSLTKHDAYARHLENREGKRFGRMVREATSIKKRGEDG